MTDVQGVIGLEDSLSFCLRPFSVNMAAQFLQEWPSFNSTCFPDDFTDAMMRSKCSGFMKCSRPIGEVPILDFSLR